MFGASLLLGLGVKTTGAPLPENNEAYAEFTTANGRTFTMFTLR